MPPALVDRLPPIWQLPSAPRLSGNRRSAAAGGLLHALQDAARLDDHRVVQRVDLPHAVEPGKAEQHAVAGRRRRRAADHAGVAALRHDRHAGGGAQSHDLGHGRGGSRLQRQPDPATIEAAPVGQPGGQRVGIFDPAAGSGGLLQPVDEIRRRVCGGWLEDNGHAGKPTVLSPARPELCTRVS
jgi:hypothetical protein